MREIKGSTRDSVCLMTSSSCFWPEISRQKHIAERPSMQLLLDSVWENSKFLGLIYLVSIFEMSWNSLRPAC